jgi:hypothetical protein
MELYKTGTTGFMMHMLDDDKSAIVRNITVFSYHPTADVVGALNISGVPVQLRPQAHHGVSKIGEPIV